MESLFSIGDRVVCVDSKGNNKYAKNPPDLIEGKDYIVDGMMKCGCGVISITLCGKHDGVTTCQCGFDYPDNFYKQTRFVKAEDNHALEEQIHQAMKGEEVVHKTKQK